jgi:hypothetical protein
VRERITAHTDSIDVPCIRSLGLQCIDDLFYQYLISEVAPDSPSLPLIEREMHGHGGTHGTRASCTRVG